MIVRRAALLLHAAVYNNELVWLSPIVVSEIRIERVTMDGEIGVISVDDSISNIYINFIALFFLFFSNQLRCRMFGRK